MKRLFFKLFVMILIVLGSMFIADFFVDMEKENYKQTIIIMLTGGGIGILFRCLIDRNNQTN